MFKRIANCLSIAAICTGFVLGSAFSLPTDASAAPPAKSLLLFDCGPGTAAPGYTGLLPTTSYSPSLGYGFEDVSKVTSRDRGAPDALRGDFCMPAGTQFKADLPNGDYQITVISGDNIASSSTGVKAEGVAIAALSSAAGQFDQKSFPVTITDGQLNLEFTGAVPRVNAVEISRIFKYDFGPGAIESGYIQVLESTAYSSERGYGFADTTKVSSRDRATSDPLRSDFTMPSGTSFLADVPNGDYQVRIISGDAIAGNSVDIKAEGLTKAAALTTAAGSYSDVTFTVSVIDSQLNVDIVGTVPRINALIATKLPNRVQGTVPNVYIAGDSTVQTYNSSFYPEAGWGQKIADYFTSSVKFTNRAIGGRSSKSFAVEGRLDAILNEIKPNDYLFIQFGHNDASSIPERHTDPYTTYKQYLNMYIDGANQRQAIPVLVTPVGRRSYDANGNFKNDFPDYVTAMKQVASERNVKLIDLNSKSIQYYNSIGVEATKSIFLWLEPGAYPNFPNGVQDNTHFQENGAIQIARLVTDGIREMNLAIISFIK
ncbi:rhamnogalacturonan acetylesterase [Paenibacillus sedimenti]|uniref:GDSL family lipase n=1 Tax=Paenibacillus sedimenti TaxID=2770274 RepID=A0A926KL00_9BACL|nr:SGNH/GDSL hydrolase family protein [Paenibacillus sedimenti]MBD0379590.1 GDSL family lipase [Paenibacillus sedimenti]